MNRCIPWPILMVVAMLAGVALPQETAERKEQLKKALKRFPDADANKDGTLTEKEARDYLNRNPDLKAKAKQGQAKTKRAEGPGIQPTHADVAYGPAPRNVYRMQPRSATVVMGIEPGGLTRFTF